MFAFRHALPRAAATAAAVASIAPLSRKSSRIANLASRFATLKLSPALPHAAKLHSTAFLRSMQAEELEPPLLEEAAPEPKPRFDSIKNLHPNTLRALKEVFRYEEMSGVQAAVLGKLPTEEDMFMKAKTGTGKTLAFLIPAIETLLAKRKQNGDNKGTIMIISPTRELAMQIADEAYKLGKFHRLNVHSLIGGDSKFKQMERLKERSPDIIVGTPGRIKDMQQTCYPMQAASNHTEVLVFDEADVLLEMGFRDEIDKIVRTLKSERQTLMFSATVSPAIRDIVRKTLRPDHTFMDLVPENESNAHLHIPQRHIIHNLEKFPELIHRILQENRNKKVILFLPTTKCTTLYAKYLYNAGVRNIFELHAGKEQKSRSNISAGFRAAKNGVLVTTDVSARGVDYPNVELVIQVGVPKSGEQYVHRIGRTGRAGKSGKAMIVMTPWESGFLSELSGMNVEPCDEWSAEAMVAKHEKGELENPADDAKRSDALKRMDEREVVQATMSLLGYYASMKIDGFRRTDLAKHLPALCTGFNIPPPDMDTDFVKRVLGGNPGGRGGNGGGRSNYGSGRSSYGGDRSSYGGDRSSYGGGRSSYGGDRSSYGGGRSSYGGSPGGRNGGSYGESRGSRY